MPFFIRRLDLEDNLILVAGPLDLADVSQLICQRRIMILDRLVCDMKVV